MEELRELGEESWYHQLQLRYWENTNAEWDPSEMYNGIGEIYLQSGYFENPSKAIKCFEKAIKISTSGDMNAVPNTKAMMNLGNYYSSYYPVENDKARKYYEEAIKYEDPNGYYGLSGLDIYYDDYQSAKEHLELGYQMASRLEKKDIELVFLFSLGNLNKNQIGDYALAVYYYEKYIDLANDEEIDNEYISALSELGDMYEHGQGVDMDIDKALEYYEKALLLMDDYYKGPNKDDVIDDLKNSVERLKQ